MGYYNLTIGYTINQTVIIKADTLEEAILEYEKGNYQVVLEEKDPTPSLLAVNTYDFDEEDE